MELQKGTVSWGSDEEGNWLTGTGVAVRTTLRTGLPSD